LNSLSIQFATYDRDKMMVNTLSSAHLVVSTEARTNKSLDFLLKLMDLDTLTGQKL